MKRHLESCVRRAVDLRGKREDFNEQYPYHCRHCEGWGGTITIDDPSMAVASVVGESAVDVDACEHCLGKGKCPRCGSQLDPEDDEPCSFCEFELGKTEGKPYPHGCFCEELEDNF
jgi:hypothetical protein